jgi:hypothetical protein
VTDTRPPRCDYDRTTGHRLTRTHHLDTCPGIGCTGCLPCTADHCVLCRARHTDDAHPLVCPTCIAGIRTDLDAVVAHTGALLTEAIDGTSQGGQLLAAAPIPGGDAMVMLGPSGDRETAAHRWDSATRGRLSKSKSWSHYADDHRPQDLEPPLSLLANWEDIWRRYLRTSTRTPANVAAAVTYFGLNLTLMAQVTDGPDIVAFARDVAGLRARLEGVLHDEHTLNAAGKTGGDAERGVECFECGVRLVRRIRDLQRCTHGTPARYWLRILLSYPELGLPRPTEVVAARLPCEKCTRRGLGGVDDPAPGLSWECLGCRKEYSPGEYATAVRRDLSAQHKDEDGRQLGWTTVPIAAEAVAERTGRSTTAKTIRTWAERAIDREANCDHPTRARRWLEVVESYPEFGDPWPAEVAAAAVPCKTCTDPGIATVCQWQPGRRFGVQLVFWPDIEDRISRVRKPGRPSTKGQMAS